jgi:hypothetical protein
LLFPKANLLVQVLITLDIFSIPYEPLAKPIFESFAAKHNSRRE